MTISTALRKAGPYTGDGQTQTYPFGFKVFDAGDVKAVASDALGNERALTASVDYSVTINPDQRQNPGGSVVLTRALPSRHRLSIISQMDFVQPVEFTNQGGFYPRVLNDSLDRLTMYTQQLDELLRRAVTLSVNHAGTYVSFPAAIPDNLLSWDSKGELVNWDLHSIVSDAIDKASSAHIASSKAVKTAYDKAVESSQSIASEIKRVEGKIDTEKQRITAIKNDISDAVDVDSSTKIASSKAVKTVYDKAAENTALINIEKARITAIKNDISDAVDVDSSTKIASSKAVKTVYDKAVENTHDIDSERLRVDGIISKVDTITGGIDLSKILSIVELTNQNLDSLNSTSNCGVYGQTNASNANVSAGYPVAKAGTLIVLPSQNGVQQLYYPHGAAFYYARGKTPGGWSAWVSAESAVQQQLTSQNTEITQKIEQQNDSITQQLEAQNKSFAKIKLLALAGL